MNDQRKVIYEQRKELMTKADIKDTVQEIFEEVLNTYITSHIYGEETAQPWDLEGFHAEGIRLFSNNFLIKDWQQEDLGINASKIKSKVTILLLDYLRQKEEKYGPIMMRAVEKMLLLRVIDQAWKDHLLILDHLREGINLRAYAQNNPLNEYKREAFNYFTTMMSKIKQEFISLLFHFKIGEDNQSQDTLETAIDPNVQFDSLDEIIPESSKNDEGIETFSDRLKKKPRKMLSKNKKITQTTPPPQIRKKPLRNSSCPCGSGKKYKHCHGMLRNES